MKRLDIQGRGMTSERTRKRLVDHLEQSGINNKIVLDSILDTPRHIFIDEAMEHRAYEDSPMPIGYGQTISQPYIVARMTEAILGERENIGTVLEIGTGSGYQAAILSKLADKVYSLERIKDLLELAKKRFSKLRLRNIITKHDDGCLGWSDHAPYDAIIVTCASKDVPDRLLSQLKNGGRLVIPVGEDYTAQQLKIITKNNNNYETTNLELVRFVPLLPGKE